ncbi:MAG TPA: M20/M25/M40 family metallo-hydrolase, partial [Gaiellaceae bacterium]|nr:M20/M25/M40 family metallo-hydrolase [Gaiellaceae bacterium]
MVELLEQLVRAESPAHDREAQREPFALLAAELEAAGLEVRAVRGTAVGDHLYARPRRRRRGAPRQLVLGHMDTAWPLGTLEAMPVRLEGGRLYGPGAAAAKGGLVVLAFALKALAAAGLEPAVTPVVFVSADEAIGSPESTRIVRLLARGAARALVLEAPEGGAGRLRIARNGSGRFTVAACDTAVRPGTSGDVCVNAILELSKQVLRLYALDDPVGGVTVNVAEIVAHPRQNGAPPSASASVDVRVRTAEAARRVEAAIRELEPIAHGAVIEVEGGFLRPPMERLARNRALFGAAVRLGRGLGLTIAQADTAGTASQANATSPYTGTLDGLGPRGGGANGAHEHVVVASLPERAALLALLLLEPAGHAPIRRRARRANGRVAIVGGAANEANLELVAGWQALGIDADLVPPGAVRHDDLVVGRLDVLPTLNGTEPGLLELLLFERRGIRVLNGAFATVRAHDKLLTARYLARAGVPHPRTVHLTPDGPLPLLALPLVVKPRFGSWGADVYRCETRAELDACVAEIGKRQWFRRHGALLQELVPPAGRDLRLVVAGGVAVGAIE